MSISPLYAYTGFGATIQDNLTIVLDLDHNAVGKPSELVKRAVRQLCGIRLPHDQFDPNQNILKLAQDYYSEIKNEDQSGQQVNILLAYVSGYFHELRHAHDLLSTVYGQDLLFLNLNYYQNIVALLQSLSTWQAMNPDLRIPIPLSEHIYELQGMPLQEDFAQLFKGYNTRRADIRAFTNPLNSSLADLTVTHLLEGSAVEIQLAIIHLFFGEEAVLRFVDFVRRGNNSNIYLSIRADMAEEFYSHDKVNLDIAELLTYLTRCSLMGTTFQDAKMTESPNPVILYESLVEHILRRSDEITKIGLQHLVEEFYLMWGFLSPDKVASHFMTVIERRLDDGKRKIAQLGGTSGQNPFIKAYEYFAATFLSMNTWISDTDLQYFSGLGYLNSYIQGLLPSVHIKVKINDELSDFMSRGYETIPFTSWNFIAAMSTTFTMLVDGRCTTPSLDFENLCFKELTSTDWFGTNLKFKDKSIF